MKYLHKFATQTQFESYYNGENYEEPFVGLIAETSGVSYNKSSVPPVPPPSPYLSVPLTIEITNGSGELTLQRTRIKYKVNDGSWILGNYETISVSSGDTIQLKQDLEVITTSNGYLPLILENSTSNDFEYSVYGNIMSVYQENAFENLTVFDTGDTYAFRNEFGYCVCLTSAENLVLPATTLSEGCYKEMFDYCTGLTIAPELPASSLTNYCYSYMFANCESLTTAIELPATTLAQYCYEFMFGNCFSLTTVPELPATTLSEGCYKEMFSNCESLTTVPSDYLPVTTLTDSCYAHMFWACYSLTTAPELPATTLAPYCYENMFHACHSLTTAPELPATTLANNCYIYMFSNCTGLTTAPELTATTLASNCYSYMFAGCSSLTTAPELPATTLAYNCYSYMFQGCTSLTTAPDLPATTLASYCYYYMFSGCTSLNYIKCLATDISATGCKSNWVKGVASSGTFIKNPNMSSWGIGVSGIPTNWTVQDAS